MADRTKSENLFGKTLNPDGTLRAVSPTQIGTFARCPLKWHFDKKGGLKKKPMGKGAALGDKCHGELDTFLNTGQDVRGALTLVGASMLEPFLWAAPFKGGPGLVEGPLLYPRLQTPAGVLITGYFDFYVPGDAARWPTIIDHKFKKSLSLYGYLTDESHGSRAQKDREKLANDPQTVIYGAWALVKQPDAPGVVVRHHQHQTEGEGGRFPLPAEVKLTRDDLLRRWGQMAGMIDQDMVAAAKVPAAMPGQTPSGVPYNIEACSDFGGCDFAQTCRHSPQNRFAALLRAPAVELTSSADSSTPTGKQTMGLLSSIQNQAPAPSAPAPAAPAATAAPVSQEPTRPPLPQTGKVYLVNARPARCEGQLGSRTIFRAKDGALLEMPSDPRAVTEADEETVCLFEGRPYVKPEPASERKRVAIVDVPDPVPNLISPPDVPAEVAVQVTVAEATQAAPAPVATAPAEEKPKRGRKPKAEPTAGSTTVDATPTAPAAAPQAPVPESKDPTQLILLVDCSCTAATDLAFYVKKTCDAVAQRFGAPDVRLGHKNSDLGFGGWKALIALEAAQTKPVGICSISSGELADPIIEALAPLATLVVRGRK